MSTHPNRARVAALAVILLMALTGTAFGQFDSVLNALPSSQHLTIPTYELSGSAVHPDVVYFRDGLNGYKFYMAMTPLYLSDTVENPSLLVSNNGVDWTEPWDSLNPIVGPPAGDHNDDPDLFWNEDTEEFLMYYLETRRDANPDFQDLRLLTSDSTVYEWDDTTAVHYVTGYPTCDPFILSPALVKKHDTYYLYYVTTPGSGCGGSRNIEYLTSTDGKNWNKDSAYSITENIPTGVDPWHVDVFDGRDGWYYLLMARYGSGYDVYLARSDDMVDWDFYQTPILTDGNLTLGDTTYNANIVYRSTGVVNSSMDLLNVWMSFKTLASPSDIWHIATRKFTLSDYFPADVIEVPSDYATIQAAINAADDGDTILVSPGTYTITSTIDFTDKNVIVKSTDGPQVTTITTTNTSLDLVKFRYNTTPTVLEGFTLQGGSKAIWCQRSAPTIRNNVMRDQNISNWAAVAISGTTYGSVGPSPATLLNNTIVSSNNGAISTFSSVAPVMRGNIMVDCAYGIHHNGWGGTVAPKLAYNNVWDCPNHYYNCPDTGVGTISSDPRFTDYYALYAGSPCIDAGDPSSYFDDPDGTRNDMGALPTWQVGSSLGYTTIQSAIDDVQEHDVVLVTSGTYTLTSSLDYDGKDIVVMSEDYDNRATITSNNDNLHLVVFDDGETADAELANLRLEGGRIAVWCQASAPTIRGCLMVDQNITNWAAVVFSGSGWAAAGSAPVTFVNNTIVNSANGGISSFSTSAATIKNTIITGCNYGIHNQGNMGTVAPNLSYNDIWDCGAHYYNCSDTGTGTISADPDLDANYELESTSPCIDAGDPSSQYNDPDNSRNDMGWLPYTASARAIADRADNLPGSLVLDQNYPNPFNPTTTIGFSLSTAQHVELTIYNVMGRKVKTLYSGVLPAGYNTFDWNSTDQSGSPVASGVYFYRLSTEHEIQSKKMLLLK